MTRIRPCNLFLESEKKVALERDLPMLAGITELKLFCE